MTIRSKKVTSYQLPITSFWSNFNRQTTGNRKPLTFSVVIILAALLFPKFGSAQASFPPVSINLNLPQYQRLKLDGGYHYIDDAGMQGVILYRSDENTYIAFERLCSAEDQAPVVVDGSGLFMNGCGSTYSFSDGYPTGGTSPRPLLKYRTSLNGQTLVITDEVVF